MGQGESWGFPICCGKMREFLEDQENTAVAYGRQAWAVLMGLYSKCWLLELNNLQHQERVGEGTAWVWSWNEKELYKGLRRDFTVHVRKWECPGGVECGWGRAPRNLGDAVTESVFVCMAARWEAVTANQHWPRESTSALALVHLPLIPLPFHNLKEPED